MTINGTDISDYLAKQWRVEFDTIDFDTKSEWVAGSPLPFLAASTVGFKEVTVTLMVYGTSREEIRNQIGGIIALCREPAVLVLDGYERLFKGILTKSSITEANDWARKRFQTVDLTFDTYEYGADQTKTATGTSVIIANPGNLTSPAIVKITPSAAIDTLTVTGLCRDSSSGKDLPVTITSLTANKTITLDGVTGLVTEGSTLREADMWALPTLLPGSNTIKFSSSVKAVVTVKPLYA